MQRKITYSSLILLLSLLITACGSDFHSLVEKPEHVELAAINADSSLAIIYDKQANLEVWDLNKAEIKYNLRLPKKAQEDVSAVAISDYNPIAVTASSYHAQIWDLEMGRPLDVIATEHTIIASKLSGTGDFLALILDNNSAEIYYLPKLSLIGTLHHSDQINSLDFSKNGRYIVTGGNDKLAKLWDITAQKLLSTWPHATPVNFVKFSPQHKYILTSATQNQSYIWKFSDFALRQTLEIHKHFFNIVTPRLTVHTARFSTDNTKIITAHAPNSLWVWDIATGKPLSKKYFPHNSIFAYRPSRTIDLSFNKNRIVTEHADGRVLWTAPSL